MNITLYFEPYEVEVRETIQRENIKKYELIKYFIYLFY